MRNSRWVRLLAYVTGSVNQELFLVADAPWDDQSVLRQVRSYALPAIQQQAPIQAWIIDDTGFPKKGMAWRGSIADSWASKTTAGSR